jgi:hypothetical protein
MHARFSHYIDIAVCVRVTYSNVDIVNAALCVVVWSSKDIVDAVQLQYWLSFRDSLFITDPTT